MCHSVVSWRVSFATSIRPALATSHLTVDHQQVTVDMFDNEATLEAVDL